MTLLPDEIRLAIAIAVNVLVFVAAYRLVRKLTSQDGIGATLDALLIHYAVQYVSVCVPGLFGVLSAESMLIVAALIGAAMWWAGRFRKGEAVAAETRTSEIEAGQPARVLGYADRKTTSGLDASASRFDALIFAVSLLFVLGYFCALIETQSTAPLVGDDALTYHLPAAGHWLQTGRIGLYNTWFFNPANTYSPLAGTAFLVWLIGPIGADLIALFAQMPALVLMFFAIVQIGRSLGAHVSVASIVAAGALLSRPFISEAILVKDDHFLAAFFIAAIAGCAGDRLRDRLGPWRMGIAVGLFFATKYTALLTAPLFLLAIDAPFRVRWRFRHWSIASACAIAIAGPWYARNWILTGNPLYPVPIAIGSFELFRGMFAPERSTEMRSISGAWKALTQDYSSLAPALVGTLALGWIGAIVAGVRHALRTPLIRVILVGPALGLGIFFLASHAALIRYAFPSLLLLFICCAVAIGRLRIPIWGQLIGAILVSAIAVWGGFNDKELLGGFVLGGVILCAVGMFVSLVIRPLMHIPRVRIAVWSIAGLGATVVVFIYWTAILNSSRATFILGQEGAKPEFVAIWGHISEKLPPTAPIAYTNTVYIRPLMGFDYARRVFYIPTRQGVQNYHDLPASKQRITDQEIRAFVAKLLTEQPDEAMWMQNLLKSPAEYLLVGKQDILPDPPEKRFADANPGRFVPEFSDASGTLYRIRR